MFKGAIADNGRFNKLNSVIGAFEKLMSAHRGEVLCVVTTAKPLEASHMKELETSLKAFMKKGENIQIETKVRIEQCQFNFRKICLFILVSFGILIHNG